MFAAQNNECIRLSEDGIILSNRLLDNQNMINESQKVTITQLSDCVLESQNRMNDLHNINEELQLSINQLSDKFHKFQAQSINHFMHHEDYTNDLLKHNVVSNFVPNNLNFQTDHPVAIDSDDHKFPWGTKQDNTRSPRFVRKCEAHYGNDIKHLDFGCSGGGLVFDFLVNGHFSIGVEGSNFSQKNCRGAWQFAS